MWFLIFVKRKRSVEDIHKQDRVQCIQTQDKHNRKYILISVMVTKEYVRTEEVAWVLCYPETDPT